MKHRQLKGKIDKKYKIEEIWEWWRYGTKLMLYIGKT